MLVEGNENREGILSPVISLPVATSQCYNPRPLPAKRVNDVPFHIDILNAFIIELNTPNNGNLEKFQIKNI